MSPTAEPQRNLHPDADSSDPLRWIAQTAAELGATELAAQAEALAERLAEGRFYVACVGQFKRGKSTLLNALIGTPLLPTGVVPITTAVTVLRYGQAVRARVRLGNEWREVKPGELAAYVSEEQNPGNQKGVSIVEVFVPSTLLASGMCLVDTPGIGSVILENTVTTRAFIPHIDAALVVIGADPPISGEEAALVADVAQYVEHVIVVLNKADRLSEAERIEAVAFAHKVLAHRVGKAVDRIFEISAKERIAMETPTRDWSELEARLKALAAQGSSQLIRRASERGFTVLTQQLANEIHEQRNALIRPIEETERHIAALRACVEHGQQALADLGHLLAAEQTRLRRSFEAELHAFLRGALDQAQSELLNELRQLRCGREQLRHQALERARELARNWVDQWLRKVTPRAETLYRQTARRFATLANEFLERLASSGAELAGRRRTAEVDLEFRVPSRLYYTELMYLTGRSPLDWLFERLLPRSLVLRHIERTACGYLKRLITTNASRVLHDLDERVRGSRRSLEQDLRGLLGSALHSAGRALERAHARRAAGEQAVQEEVQRLQAIQEDLDRIVAQHHPAAERD